MASCKQICMSAVGVSSSQGFPESNCLWTGFQTVLYSRKRSYQLPEWAFANTVWWFSLLLFCVCGVFVLFSPGRRDSERGWLLNIK